MNLFGYFDADIRKQKGSRLLSYYDKVRASSPASAKMISIDQKYGGVPKTDQLVREGHYPKFSEMIDKIESIAMDYIKFENYLETSRNQNMKERQDTKDILSGKISLD